MAKFKVGDKVAVRSGGYGKIVAIKPNGMYKIEGGGMEGSFPESELVKATNSCASTNPVVQNAMEAKNDAYTGFGLFKDYKTFAAMELASFSKAFNEIGNSLKREADLSKRWAEKQSERELIDECCNKCLNALKEAFARIEKQKSNVML